jgi:DNA-binding transcriptional ArsR family regulator
MGTERSETGAGAAEPPVLPENVPVTMPDLPLQLTIATPEQFKAIADPTRNRILGIIQNQPATAKQIATNLGASPGTIGHHLQVLEAAGLAQVVARRLVRGIVAKYYTRTARLFSYKFSSEVMGVGTFGVDLLLQARDELSESVVAGGKKQVLSSSFPHRRLSRKRARYYAQRLDALLDEMLAEPHDPDGQVYGMVTALFLAPPYLQRVEGPPVVQAPRRRKQPDAEATAATEATEP